MKNNTYSTSIISLPGISATGITSSNIRSGFTVKSAMDVQNERMYALEQRLTEMEVKFNDMQEFLDYKGIKKDEFADFIESRKLVNKMLRDQQTEFPYIELKLEVTPVVPVDHIVLKYNFVFDDKETDDK